MPQLPKRVAIVTLDLFTEDNGYYDYHGLSPKQKINFIDKKIRVLCEKLGEFESDAKWIFAWHEYGVYGQDNWSIAQADKKYLKEKMHTLTKDFPQLAIVAGTVKTEKAIRWAKRRENEMKHELPNKQQKIVNDLNKSYDDHVWLINRERVKGSPEALRHKGQFIKAIRDYTPYKYKVRNTCYVFANDKCVARHDKSAPFEEVSNPNCFYQMPKGRNVSPYIEITFADGMVVPIGVEVCREHYLGVLKYYCETKRLKKPLIHFVTADSINEHEENIYGDFYLHIDSAYEPVLYSQHDATVDVAFYRNHLPDPDDVNITLMDESIHVKNNNQHARGIK